MSKHFNPNKEFSCKCCGVKRINPHLIAVLELVRHNFGSSVVVTSSYRCEKHNKAVGGAKRSQHRLGTAADIQVEGVEPSEVYKFLNEVFPDSYGLGSYNTFTHIDVRANKARWGK
jgi:uncharacterized protein YcbK (DUF882 family)